MNEAHGPEPWKYQVGSAGEPADVKTISEAAGMESPTQCEFG